LVSDLGGGKTTFVRGLAKGLGSKDEVSSPSYTINNIYQCRHDINLWHYDFYRLDHPGIIANEIAESQTDPKAVTAVEWGGLVKDVLKKNRIMVEIKSVAHDQNSREVIFHYHPSYETVVDNLKKEWKD
jgi:tRNA threonylcarbamoyladenosine biosynthesis protein TsaE